jgi:hypothetical protein
MKANCHPAVLRGNNGRVKGRNRKMGRAGMIYALAVKIHAMDMKQYRPNEECKRGKEEQKADLHHKQRARGMAAILGRFYSR